MGEPAETLPDNVLVLRAPDGTTEVVPDTPENRATRDRTAEERRAEFLFNKAGALARAGELPRLLTANLAAGVTNAMLVHLMQGTLKPQTAKEAADIAKITHGIFKEASGSSSGVLTPAERGGRMEQIDKLQVELKLRAGLATDQVLGGALPDGEPVPDVRGPEPEPDQWEHETPQPPAAE